MAQKAVSISDAREAATSAPAPRDTARTTLCQAAADLLAAWDNRDTDIIVPLEAAMYTLDALLTEKASRPDGTPRKPREGIKQEAVLTMLSRPEGATVLQISEATGWASHAVRGFLAGLKKKGIQISTLERVRKVGPGKEGSKGSYTVYAIGECAH